MRSNTTVKFSSSKARAEKRELKREKEILRVHRIGTKLLRDRPAVILQDPNGPMDDRILIVRLSPERAEMLEKHGGEIAIVEVDVLP